jgi:hypothetical protein
MSPAQDAGQIEKTSAPLALSRSGAFVSLNLSLPGGRRPSPGRGRAGALSRHANGTRHSRQGLQASVFLTFTRNETMLATVKLLAIIFVALCLVPTGAHFFELPNKMALSPQHYMVVQTIYAGWAFFGIAVFGALAFTLAHTILVRGDRTAMGLSLAAFLLLVATQVIFWTFTYPMNVASANWTVMPDHFEAARRQWEYSHAVSAALTLVALILLCGSMLRANSH